MLKSMLLRKYPVSTVISAKSLSAISSSILQKKHICKLHSTLHSHHTPQLLHSTPQLLHFTSQCRLVGSFTSSSNPAPSTNYSTGVLNIQEIEEDDNLSGPDQILPASSHKCWLPSTPVQLQMTPEGLESIAPESVYSFLKNATEKFWDKKALADKVGDTWRFLTYEDYFEESRLAAKSFLNLGLERFHGVCLMGFNSPEWFIANYGAIFAGGITAGIYVNSSTSNALHVIKDSRAQFVVVDNADTAERFLAVKDQLPHIKAIIQYHGIPPSEEILTWRQFIDIGRTESDGTLDDTLKTMAVNQCCSLVYTSGTTSAPKGVMCSHDNLTWSCKVQAKAFELKEGGENTVSYLPMNHIAAQILDIYVTTTIGATLYFADSNALKGTLLNTLQEIQPTGLLTIPRLLEKMYEKINTTVEDSSAFRKSLFKWATTQGRAYHDAVNNGRKINEYQQFQYNLARKLVLNKIKPRLGLAGVQHMGTGSAPISDNILDFFSGLDLPVANIYGMSETMSIGTMGYAKFMSTRHKTVGKRVLDVRSKVQSLPDNEREGEVCFKGRSVFMGYLNNEEKTNETIQEDGWLKSGDMGYFDPEGFLCITGRLKELIITAGGENIPPLMIEEELIKLIPIAGNTMVVGDGKKYLTVLLTLKSEKELDTEKPLDELMPFVKTWLRQMGCQLSKVSEVRQLIEEQPEGKVAMAIQAAIDRYNSHHALSNVHQIKKWSFLPNEFSVNTGELTQTLKLKRSVVCEMYGNIIDDMYKEDVEEECSV